MAETWQSAPDAPGLWWRDGGDGPVAWEVRVSPLRRGGLFAQEAVGEECDTIRDLSPRSGVRWARCLPPEVLAPGEPTRAELAAQLAAVTAERDGLREEVSTGAAAEALAAARRGAAAEILDMLSRGLSVADVAAEYAVGDVGDALAAARREGAEAMRGAVRRICAENIELVEGVMGMRDVSTTSGAVLCASDQSELRGIQRIAREVEALPPPGDATPEHAPTPAPVCPAPTEGT